MAGDAAIRGVMSVFFNLLDPPILETAETISRAFS